MRTIPLLALLILHTGATRSQVLEQQLQTIATQRGLVGMSVVATCGGEVTHVVHTGLRRIAQNLPVNDDTRYRIASISKLVTAIGLMQLYEQGAFSLDDDVSPALGFSLRNPQHPTVPITYRMLLGHRASVQDGSGYTGFLNATYATAPPPPIQQVLVPGGAWYTANMWRTEPPGTWFTYSNVAYGIIGTLIEAHSGMRFDQYMRQHVLLPLGIHGSYNVQDLDEIGHLAVLYRNNNPQADNFGGVMPPAPDLSGYVIGSNGLYFAPQGGLRCSALELARLLLLMHGEGTVDGATVLQASTWSLMRANEWTWNGSNGDNYFGLFRSWGLGVHRVTAQPGGDVVLPGTFMLGHAGEAYGLISDLYLDPASGFGLVFITNGYSPGNNYTAGLTSAFYRVEEEVFAALAQHAQPACITTLVPEREAASPRLTWRDDQLWWNGPYALDVDLFDTLGRRVERLRLESGEPVRPSIAATVARGIDQRGTEHRVRMR
jgi:CubicO group peptidase (beta-lactamase class C family)